MTSVLTAKKIIRAAQRRLTGVSRVLKEEKRALRKEQKRMLRKAQLGEECKAQQMMATDWVPVIADLPTISSTPDPLADVKRQRKDFRNLAKLYAIVLAESMALHDHHSITPGRTDWAEKWRTCTGKRILYFTVSDYSGSFYKWAEAINRHTPHAVRMVSLIRHRFGYPLDILSVRGQILVTRFPSALHDILRLIDEADIVHIKDQTGFIDGKNGLPPTLITQFRKPIVYTLYGGTSRRDEVDPVFQSYVKSHAAVIAMTPDLCFDWCSGIFVPHNIDEDRYPFSWTDGKLIMHTPSTASRKGTSFFRPAAERVSGEIGGRVEIITGTKHDYIMRHKPLATIFFDQAGRESEEHGGRLIGWYGNSALEAAVFGVPTMAHLSQEAIDRAARAGYDVASESAILNVEPNEEGIYRTMRDFFDMTPEQRGEFANKTRKWIEKHHSYRATAKQLAKVYEDLN